MATPTLADLDGPEDVEKGVFMTTNPYIPRLLPFRKDLSVQIANYEARHINRFTNPSSRSNLPSSNQKIPDFSQLDLKLPLYQYIDKTLSNIHVISSLYYTSGSRILMIYDISKEYVYFYCCYCISNIYYEPDMKIEPQTFHTFHTFDQNSTSKLCTILFPMSEGIRYMKLFIYWLTTYPDQYCQLIDLTIVKEDNNEKINAILKPPSSCSTIRTKRV